MTQRAQRFTDPNCNLQLAVESRRRGDSEQYRYYSSHKACVRCRCGYTSTKLVYTCPICGAKFANGFANGRPAPRAATFVR